MDDGPVVPNACASIAFGRAASDIDGDAGPARRDDAPQEREGQQARAARTDVAAEPEEARGAGVGVLLEPVVVFDFGHSSYVVFGTEHLLQQLLAGEAGAFRAMATGCVGFGWLAAPACQPAG